MKAPLLAIILVLCSCNLSPESDANTLNPGAAPRNAKTAIDSNDFRLLGVAGLSVELPGVEITFEEAETLYGVRVIERTGDVYEGGVTRERNEQATRYARAYNETILEKAPPSSRRSDLPR